MRANQNPQAHEHALHTLGGQADGGDRCDLTGGQSLPVAKPENGAFSLLVLARRNLPQSLIDLLQLKAFVYSGETVRVRSGWSDLGGLGDGVGFACPALYGMH